MRSKYDHSTTHGMSYSRIYKVWDSMLRRCYNEQHHAYKDYGARGIAVCREWWSFENFYADMGEKPNGLTLERKDNALGYSKDNCIWATSMHQANNRRNNVLIQFNGETKTVAEWSRQLGIPWNTIMGRYSKGFPIDKNRVGFNGRRK